MQQETSSTQQALATACSTTAYCKLYGCLLLSAFIIVAAMYTSYYLTTCTERQLRDFYRTLRRYWEFMICSATLDKRILFLGLDNSGKTTLLRMIEDDKIRIHPPSRLEQGDVVMGKIRFDISDIGWMSKCTINQVLG